MRLGYSVSSSHLVRGAKIAVIDLEADGATADRTQSPPGVHGTLKENKDCGGFQLLLHGIPIIGAWAYPLLPHLSLRI